jgi:hypothetical protein
MIRLRSSYFVAALLAACSPVEDNRDIDAPAADTTAPSILKSTPADMARKISVLQPVTVVFDEDVDPATVTAATVELSYADTDIVPFYQNFSPQSPIGGGMPKHLVPAAVTFDAVSRTLRLVPKAPLPFGRRFTLALSGVKDVAGNELTTSVKFMTAVNLAIRSRPFTSQAQPQPYTETIVDANGFASEHVLRVDAGVDMIWFNTDDKDQSFIDVVNKSNGQPDFEWVMGPGDDADLHTTDDTIVAGLSYKYDAAGLPIEQAVHEMGMAGVDLMFGTPDDEIGELISYKYQAGLLERRVYFSDAGLVDMAWRTADDQCSTSSDGALVDLTYDIMGRRTREVRKGCGPDRLPSNTDDTFVRYFDYQYDANHALTRTVSRTGPGLNGMWLDSDDDIGSIENYVVDPNGLVTEFRYYGSAGVNGMWEDGGGDDVLSRLTKYTYDANKQPIQVTTYGAGMDAKLGTPDDVVLGYQQTTYDALGNRVRSRTFDVGPDTAPFTGDDRLQRDVEHDTMH